MLAAVPAGQPHGTMDGVPLRVLSIVAVVGLAACGGSAGPAGCPPGSVVPLTIGSGSGAFRMQVEIADDEGERATGLMGRTALPEGTGMAFLYDEPAENGFWMKDTTIPLSIAFWGEDERISDVLDMEPCTEDPCTVYEPAHPFVGAVEAVQGSFEEAGVGVGDRVAIEEVACA